MNRWIASGVFLALGVVTLLLRHTGRISDTFSSTVIVVLLLLALVSNIALARRER